MAAQAILQQMVTAVLIIDSNGLIRFANASAESMLAGSSRRLKDAPLESLFQYSSFDFDILHEAQRQQKSLSDSDVSLVLHDAKTITVELVVSPCELDDGQSGQLLELRQVDLIRRLNQEQAQQHQLAAAQKLVRGLAHEIKNPLGGIRGAAQLLAGKLAEAGLREYTQLIITQSDRLRELVDRLLGPNQPGQRQPKNLHQLIENSLQVLSLDKPEGVDFVKDYDPSIPEIKVAGHQLEQVLLNIIKNAVLAVGDQGTVQVRTRVVHQETIYGKRYRQCALVSIIDNGPGVDPLLKDTLFYPLVSGREGGTGLGLSIAQSLVHQHAGKIEVNSRPGHTEFVIYLPYSEDDIYLHKESVA